MLVVDRRILDERRAKVEAELRNNGFDGLVLFAQGSAVGSSSKSHGYMSFLADWDSYNTNGMLLLVPGSAPVLFVSNIFLKCMTERMPKWIDDVRMGLGPDFARVVLQAIGEKIPSPKRLAIIGRNEMPLGDWNTLSQGLDGTELVDFESFIDPMRVVKDAAQYSIHYRGAEICDQMFQNLRQEIKKSQPVCVLQNSMTKLAQDQGAEHALVWLSIAPVAEYCLFRREEAQRVPQMGDQVIVGIYLLFHGHWAHALRMGTYGAPSPAQQRAFDIVLGMENAGLEAIRPGGNLYDVHWAFEKVYRNAFSETDDDTMFRFRAAHGLGHTYEDPIASIPFPQPYAANRPTVPGRVEFGYDRHAPGNNPPKDKFLEVKPGMLFEFHPNFFQKGVAGAAIGDMIYMGGNGPEIMTEFPRENIRWDM